MFVDGDDFVTEFRDWYIARPGIEDEDTRDMIGCDTDDGLAILDAPELSRALLAPSGTACEISEGVAVEEGIIKGFGGHTQYPDPPTRTAWNIISAVVLVTPLSISIW